MTLVCGTCGSSSSDTWRCDCGGLLTFPEAEIPTGNPPDDWGSSPSTGVWTFDQLLPVEVSNGPHSSLGEGLTPLVSGDTPGLSYKLEYLSPTGSFKDRGAATLVSYALKQEETTITDDSSGNAGSAIAAYGASAGLDVIIYSPASISRAKAEMMTAMGAEVRVIEGPRSAVTQACHEAVSTGEAWYASHAWHPAFPAGTATMAYEIAADRGFTVPDAIVVPVGHGSLFVGTYLGFRQLHQAGWIDSLPRLIAAQSTAVSPIVDTVHHTGRGSEHPPDTIAKGICIDTPAQETRILEGLTATDGDAVAVSDEQISDMLQHLHHRGLFVEPTAAVAPAAYRLLLERDLLAPDDDVVVPLTGSGFKG